jgi:hypothetical protein
VNASTEPEMEIKEAFNRAVEQHADALLIHVDALFNDGAGQSQIIALAGQHRLPTRLRRAQARLCRDQPFWVCGKDRCLRCGSPRPDSEQFRSAPRTCVPFSWQAQGA